MLSTQPCQTANANDGIAEIGPRQAGTPTTGQSDFVGGLVFSAQRHPNGRSFNVDSSAVLSTTNST